MKPTYISPSKKKRVIHSIVIERGKRGDYSPVQPDHCHDYYEIFYLLSGSCRFLLKDTVYQIEKGDLVFIAPGELHHAIYQTGNSCEVILLYFKKEHLDSNFAPADHLTLHSFMGTVSALYQEDFNMLLSRMLSENTHIDEFSESFKRCLLSEVLLMLMRHSVMNMQEPTLLRTKDADILLATKYIYKNFQKTITLDEVSAVSSLSPTYFSKKFKQTTGMGFKEYLNYVRLKHAQTALLTTSNSITDIALACGFNDSNYFKDLFKKVYGKSPREFRKSKE